MGEGVIEGDLGVDNGWLWRQYGDLFEFELSAQIIIFCLLILSAETTVGYVLFSLSSKYFLISVIIIFFTKSLEMPFQFSKVKAFVSNATSLCPV